MSQLDVRTIVEDDTRTSPASSPAAWRWAGGLALAYVVIVFAALPVEGVMTDPGASSGELKHQYASVAFNRILAGGYVESLAFLVLVPALVTLGRRFGRRTETSRAAAQSFAGLGLCYAAATLAIGFTPMFAAAYGAHHGVDAQVLSTVNDLRNYGYLLQVAISLAMTLALGVAALAEGVFVRWVGWGGVLVGSLGLVATPFARNATGMVQIVWWIGLAVLCLRGGPKKA